MNIPCKIGLHQYSYSIEVYGGIEVIEKKCMRCGYEKIENPRDITEIVNN